MGYDLKLAEFWKKQPYHRSSFHTWNHPPHQASESSPQVKRLTRSCANPNGYASASFVLKPPVTQAPDSCTCGSSVCLHTFLPSPPWMSWHFIFKHSTGTGFVFQSQHRVGFCQLVLKKQKSHRSSCHTGKFVKSTSSGTDHIMLLKGFSRPHGIHRLQQARIIFKACLSVALPFRSVLRSPSCKINPHVRTSLS